MPSFTLEPDTLEFKDAEGKVFLAAVDPFEADAEMDRCLTPTTEPGQPESDKVNPYWLSEFTDWINKRYKPDKPVNQTAAYAVSIHIREYAKDFKKKAESVWKSEDTTASTPSTKPLTTPIE